MITSQQAKEFKEYRDKGYTYRQIAKIYGCSHQRVAYVLTHVYGCNFRPLTEKRCKYPGLMRWMNCNQIGIQDLAKILYKSAVGGTTLCGIRSRLKGDSEWNQWQIESIIKESGMTYEELFLEGRYE